MRSGGKSLNDRIGSGFHNNGREHGGSGGLRGPMQAFGGENYQWVSQAQTTLPNAAKVAGVKICLSKLKFF